MISETAERIGIAISKAKTPAEELTWWEEYILRTTETNIFKVDKIRFWYALKFPIRLVQMVQAWCGARKIEKMMPDETVSTRAYILECNMPSAPPEVFKRIFKRWEEEYRRKDLGRWNAIGSIKKNLNRSF